MDALLLAPSAECCAEIELRPTSLFLLNPGQFGAGNDADGANAHGPRW